ncbi:putative disease resistance RPP13-like protein 1 [Argentina anserina]|uniref:putative disease resistance RPP13-like protein 1 n=1 Tax=Argentina anserina TaxID=57926 RepID=UPI002176762E|nr:putative disease resistance RPP13-like protein 1 [Potentilla anserina]
MCWSVPEAIAKLQRICTRLWSEKEYQQAEMMVYGLGLKSIPQLCASIEESKIVVVVLSTNYFSSRWCLDQLVKAFECNKLIVPVFDGIDSIALRSENGPVADTFSNHQLIFSENPEKVRIWRRAIDEVANLGGWHLHSDESQIIEDIVQSVCIKLKPGEPEPLRGLFLYCCLLFPEGYEFRRHEVVQLWIAQGFDMGESPGETMEDAGIKHFNFMESLGLFERFPRKPIPEFDDVITEVYYCTPTFYYKVNLSKLSLLEDKSSGAKYFRVVDGKFDQASESTTQHMCLMYKDVDDMAFGVIQKFKNLRTLLVLPGYGSSVKRIPADLFRSLNFLTTLNLSGTLIFTLPGSIGDVQSLRYIDLSRTPIFMLPESICSLDKLQTLKLRGCRDLLDLPKSMHKLAALRHLDFNIQQLHCMPPHFGRLHFIQTLSAFIVGTLDGHRIQELKNLNDLTGALCIFQLENVLMTTDAKEANLASKKRLQRLDLLWNSLLLENTKLQEDIIESLLPPFDLKELNITSYGGTKLPSWLSHPSFTDLIVITLDNCAYCEHLPSIGQLPALKLLSIVNMDALKEIDHIFLSTATEPVHQVFQAFPKLEILEFENMANLIEWKKVKRGDFPSLLQLRVKHCPELVILPSFSHLKSLKCVQLYQCPKLVPPELPITLKSIDGCKEGDKEFWL